MLGRDLLVLRALWLHRNYRWIGLFTSLGYGLSYALATGMLMVFPSSIEPKMLASGLSLPYFSFAFLGPPNWWNPYLVWIPNGHLELVLYLGPFLSLLALSALAGINFALLAHSLKVRREVGGVRPRPAGCGGLLAFLPPFLMGNACCVVNLGMLALGALIPSSLLFTIQFRMGWLVSLLSITFMLLSALHMLRGVGRVGVGVGRACCSLCRG